jgi:hypothetical protein
VKYWSALVVAFMLILALSWCAHAECAGSGRAVLDGGASHATWRIVDGGKCWFAGRPKRRAIGTRAADLVLGKVNDRVRVPLPRPNPLDAPRPTYDVEAALLRFMMFGTLANVR